MKRVNYYEEGDRAFHQGYGVVTVTRAGIDPYVRTAADVEIKVPQDELSGCSIYSSRGPYMKVYLTTEEALSVYHQVGDAKIMPTTADELMEELGCGRETWGVDWTVVPERVLRLMETHNKLDKANWNPSFGAIKERYPPVFYIYY